MFFSLGPLWGHLVAVWDFSWGNLGAVLELLGSSWCVFLLSWASLGPSRGCLRPLLGLSWAEFTLCDEHGIIWSAGAETIEKERVRNVSLNYLFSECKEALGIIATYSWGRRGAGTLRNVWS